MGVIFLLQMRHDRRKGDYRPEGLVRKAKEEVR